MSYATLGALVSTFYVASGAVPVRRGLRRRPLRGPAGAPRRARPARRRYAPCWQPFPASSGCFRWSRSWASATASFILPISRCSTPTSTRAVSAMRTARTASAAAWATRWRRSSAYGLGDILGWRTALLVMGAAGLVALALLATQRSVLRSRAHGASAPQHTLANSVELFRQKPILLCFAYFVRVDRGDRRHPDLCRHRSQRCLRYSAGDRDLGRYRVSAGQHDRHSRRRLSRRANRAP